MATKPPEAKYARRGLCTCAMHCASGPFHERACCDEVWCDCWCHEAEYARRAEGAARLLPLMPGAPGEPTEFLDRMGRLSARLQDELAAAGIGRGDGIRLVSRLARDHGLRDWPHTRCESDYETLIEAVRRHLHGEGMDKP